MAVKQVFNTSAELDYPKVLPTLDLDFANTKTLDPRIEFTRASGGSYVGADGLIKYAGVNEARFDHDPETGESLGLLVEESRTNLLKYSGDWSGTTTTSLVGQWNSVGTLTLTQNQTGVDGVANSALLYEDLDTAGDQSFLRQRISTNPTGTNPYCFSFFGKRIDSTAFFDFYAFFTGSSVKGTSYRYNWDTETIGVGGADGGGNAPLAYGTIPYGNGWYRFWFAVIDADGTNTETEWRIYASGRGGGVTGSIVIYGPQVEQGSFPTSYIPTQGSTRTRAVDNAQITGTNFSDWYNSSEWTLMIAARRNYSGNFLTYPNLARVNDGTNNNTVGFYGALNNTQFTNYSVNSGGVNQTPYVAINVPTTSQFKMIQALKENDSTFGGNGTLTTTDTSVLMPVGVNQLFIGSNDGSSWWGGTISQLTYYPKRLPNSQLIALTE